MPCTPHSTANWREQIGNRLGGLNLAEAVGSLHLCTHGRQLHVHDVAERILRIVGDSDASMVTFQPNPLVVSRVTKIFRDSHPHRLAALRRPLLPTRR